MLFLALTLCRLGNFADFFCHLLIFFSSKLMFSENAFSNTIRVSNSFDPDEARHFVGLIWGQNCLQMLSADDTNSSRHRVKELHVDIPHMKI